MEQAGSGLRVRLIDPDRDRQESERLLEDHGLSGRELADGVVLVQAGEGSEIRRAHLLPGDLVTYATGPEVQVNGPRVKAFRGEEALLSKFLEVSDPRQTRICYTQGHGEPAFDDLEPYAGYAHLRDLLRDANLEVRVADLDARDGLEECDLLLVAGPRGPLPSVHVEVIDKFVERGGDLLVLAGAVVLRGRAAVAPNGLEPMLSRRGIRYGERIVLDPHTMAGASPLLAFTLDTGWADHPAVRSLVMRPISFIAVRELSVEGDAVALIETGPTGWAETDIKEMQFAFDEGLDRRGPIPLAAASEQAGSRVVVVASDQFALNAWLRDDVAYDHGRDFILNTIAWLTQREALLGIRPREREHVKLVLQDEQLRRMRMMCLVGLPGFAVALGFLVLWRRRI
jgi:ABC-2 type transport system permease protein